MRHTDGMGDAQRSYIRRIVREEIVAAFQAMAREAETYDGGEIKDMAADMLSSVLSGTVVRLACSHEKTNVWGQHEYREERCSRCSEPIPAPDNPFEEQA